MAYRPISYGEPLPPLFVLPKMQPKRWFLSTEQVLPALVVVGLFGALVAVPLMQAAAPQRRRYTPGN